MLTKHCLHVINISKNKNRFIDDGISHYSKNIKKFCNIKWQYLNEARFSSNISRKLSEESASIEKAIKSIKSSYVVCLDEKARLLDSHSLSKEFNRWMNSSMKITFVIGGPFGLSPLLKEQADSLISLSPMTLDHQLIRLVLAEQIFRVLSIIYNTEYHH